MISLDADYLALKPYLEAECKRRRLDFQFTELNPTGWGDMMFISELTGIHNVEIKQAGEYIGNVDHLINQIKAQSEMSDHLWLFIYGMMEEAEDGNSYSLRWDKPHRFVERPIWGKGYDSGVQRVYNRRYHRVNWDGQRKILWRFREVGVQVVEVRNLEELASELCLLYEAAQTEGSTFTRLIKEKIRVSESDPVRAAFMKTLMGIEGAGIGEEVADAIANWVEHYPTEGDRRYSLAGLLLRLSSEMMLAAAEEFNYHPLETQPLRSGKRSVGPAAVARLKAALGI